MDDGEIYESVKSSLYIVWSLLFTVVGLWTLDYLGVIPGDFQLPPEVYVYGTGILMSIVLGFTIADRVEF